MARANLATIISLDSTKFRSGLRAAASGTRAFGRGVTRSFGTAIRSVNRLNRALIALGVNRGMVVAARKAARLTSNLTKLTAVLAAVGTTFVFKKALDAAAKLEVLDVAYASLTGSVTVARQSLRELNKQALKTGVAMEVQSDAVQKFLALGFKPDRAIRLQRAILDVSGAMGLTAFQAGQLGFAISQVAAKGVVQMEELRQQISEKGVPIFEALSQKTGLWGIELQKAVKEGKVGAEVLLEIFENYEGPFARFRGGAERLGSTFTGTIKRMREAIQQLFRDFGTPVITQFKRIFDVVFRFFRGLRGEARKFGDFLAKGFRRAAIVLETMLSLFRANLLGARFKSAFEKLGRAIPLALRIGFAKLVPLLNKAAAALISSFAKLLKNAVSKEFGGALKDGIGSALTLLSGMGKIIRSQFSPSVNEFIGKLQATIELLPFFVRDAISELKRFAYTMGSIITNAAAKLVDALPFGGNSQPLKDTAKEYGFAAEKLDKTVKIWDQSNDKLSDIVDHYIKANQNDELAKSGDKDLNAGVQGVFGALGAGAQALTGLKFPGLEDGIARNRLELQGIFAVLASNFGFNIKDNVIQKQQLKAQQSNNEATKKVAGILEKGERNKRARKGKIDATIPEERADRRSKAQKASDAANEAFFKKAIPAQRLAEEKLGPKKEEKFSGLDFFKKEDLSGLSSLERFKRTKPEDLVVPGQSLEQQLQLRKDQLPPSKAKVPDVGRGVGKEINKSQEGLLNQLQEIATSLQTLQLI